MAGATLREPSRSRPQFGRLSRIARGEPSDGGPVKFTPAIRKQRQEAIAQQTCERHGYPQVICGGEDEPDILVAKRRGEAGGLELLVGNQLAIGLVNGSAEQGPGQDLKILLPI